MVEAEQLVRQLEDAWNKEEIYWWQRPKIVWLNCGDKNSKFFQNNVVQQRQQNKILRLNNDNEIWLEEKVDINKAFSDFFLNMFNTGGTRQLDQALSYVKTVVTNNDNARLIELALNQEIEWSQREDFSMLGNKAVESAWEVLGFANFNWDEIARVET
ncbi:hypothetical protein K1719_002783 [Acacia pycnantha]|nr:hypothetical protein K1719_002783 [Acacia pycnantha]